ncbi:MAG: replicative DNA helicase [Fibromonadales bacterium]|nr:replicative DNA helicase [Fibromonadales bacterium]
MSEYYLEYPRALDAEVWLLGGILQDPKILGEVSLILRHDTEFYLEKHQAVWNAMVKLYREDKPIDVLTIADILEKDGKLLAVGGKDYIFSLMESVPSAANADYYAEMIRGKYILRTLISTSNETIKESLAPAAITEDVLQAAEKRIFDLTTDQVKENVEHAGDVAKDVMNMLAMRGQDFSGCPTNFTAIDNLTNGLQKSNLIILAARPGMGKTSFALNIATNAARLGKTVLFFSLEMSPQDLVMRILSSMAEFDQSRLRRSGKIDSETTKVLLARATELSTMQLYLDGSTELRAFDLLSKCRVFKRKHNNNLDLVVVDYLQMIKTRSDVENRAIGVSEVSYSLKLLAKELKIPVLALAQLNRKVEERHPAAGKSRPQLSDLRDSGSIEQDADMVWFIHQQKEKNNKNDDGFQSTEDDNLRTLIVAKNRNGPTADIELEFHKEFTTFKDHIRTSAPYSGNAGFGAFP